MKISGHLERIGNLAYTTRRISAIASGADASIFGSVATDGGGWGGVATCAGRRCRARAPRRAPPTIKLAESGRGGGGLGGGGEIRMRWQ